MAKKKINAQGQEISLIEVNGQDYFSLTDMAKKFGPIPSDFIKGWLRNKDTIEYLGAWEQLYNKSFKRGEFTPFKDQAGTNRFRPSVKDWIKSTAAIGIQSKSGRFGGTYAHKDIAFHFGMWLSPVFQLFVVKEFDRLKEIEEEARTEANEEFKDSKFADRIQIKAKELALKKIRASQGSQDETNRFMEIFENQQ